MYIYIYICICIQGVESPERVRREVPECLDPELRVAQILTT